MPLHGFLADLILTPMPLLFTTAALTLLYAIVPATAGAVALMR